MTRESYFNVENFSTASKRFFYTLMTSTRWILTLWKIDSKFRVLNCLWTGIRTCSTRFKSTCICMKVSFFSYCPIHIRGFVDLSWFVVLQPFNFKTENFYQFIKLCNKARKMSFCFLMGRASLASNFLKTELIFNSS